MTKEEIRGKHLLKNGLSVNNTAVGKKIQKASYDAMDEYARTVAIEFAEHLGHVIGHAESFEQIFDSWYEPKNKQP